MTIFITRNSYFFSKEKFHQIVVIFFMENLTKNSHFWVGRNSTYYWWFFLLEYLMKIPTFEYVEILPISGDF
jgi:hypothetical protein